MLSRIRTYGSFVRFSHSVFALPFALAGALLAIRGRSLSAFVGWPLVWILVAMVAALLVYEQSLVRADDLSQVKRAFDLNGYVGILYLLVLVVSLYAVR